MANYFDRFDGSQGQSTNFFDQFDTVAKPAREEGFLAQAADIPIGLAKGLYGGAEMISNLFGAESEVSKNLRGIQGYLNDLMSAQARQDQQKMAEIMKDAEDKGVADQLLAAVKAFSVAPVDIVTQALGTSAPTLLTALAGTLIGAPAALGLGARLGLGALMGAGTIKGTIYQETKQALLDAGVSEKEAEQRAVLAQEYGGKNLDQILAGAAIGGLAAGTGLETSIAGPVAKRILGKAAAKDAAEESVKRGLASRTLRGAGAEALPEGTQGAQEQLAANIAAQREGLNVPTMRGVVSSGALEALAGAPLGGIGGALEGGPRVEKPEAEPEATTEQPKPETVMTVPAVDDQGNPFNVQVVRQPDGTIEAIGPNGETVNIGEMVNDPTNVDEIKAAVDDSFNTTPVTEEAAATTEEVKPAPEGAAAPAPVPAPETEPAATTEAPAPVAQPEPVKKPKPIEVIETTKPEEAAKPEAIKLPDYEPFKEMEGVSSVYTTSRGSTYAHFDDNTTIRNRSGKDHTDKTTGVQKRSVKTFYVDKDALNKLGMYQFPEVATQIDPVVDPDTNKVIGARLIYPEGYGPKPPGSVVAEVPVSMTPQVGMYPVEVYSNLSPAGDAGSGIHFGTEIVEVKSPSSLKKPEAAKPAPVPEATEPTTKEAPVSAFPGMETGPKYELDRTPDQLQKELTKLKTLNEAADWAVKNAPNELVKAIAEKVRTRLNEFAELGYEMPFKVSTGDRVAKGHSGITRFKKLPKGYRISITLNGAIKPTTAKRAITGMNYSTVLHELVHATTALQIFGLKTSNKTVQDLNKLFNDVKKKMSRDLAAGVKHPAIAKYARGANIIQNPDELLAWGLTDKDFQDYLKDIKLTKEVTGFSKFVQIVRDMLNLSDKYQTALEAVVETGDILLSQDISEMRKELAKNKISMKSDEQADRSLKAVIFEGFEEEPKKIVKGRSRALADAAERRVNREISQEEYEEILSAEQPIDQQEKVFPPDSDAKIKGALKSNQVEKVNTTIAPNTPVGLRLDIPAKEKHGVRVVTIHKKRSSPDSAKPGSPIGYAGFAKIKDAVFAIGNPQKAAEIAKGQSKDSLQTIEGRYVPTTKEEIVSQAEEALNSDSWTPVGFDPTRHSYFYDRRDERPVESASEVIQIGSQVWAKDVVYGDKDLVLYQKPGENVSNESRGKAALGVIEDLGRAPEPTVSKTKQFVDKVKNAVEDPKGTAESAQSRTKQFLDMLETKVFSSDAALNNRIRKFIGESFAGNEKAMGLLLQISTSQAVHDDALANLFMQMGGLEYDEKLYKYKGVNQKENLKALVAELVKISDKYKLTQEQAQRVAHTAFEAKRLKSLKAYNAKLKGEIDQLRDDARNASTPSSRDAAKAQIRKKTNDFKYIHMTDEQIAAGLNLFNTIPELTKLVDTWNKMRENAVDVMVKSGLWSRDDANTMLDNVDYVPFYREEQLAENQGPKEFLRSYLVQAREKKLKGSDKPVNDIFDNMARWTQHAIKRSVRNKQAQNMVKAAVKAKLAKEVESRSDGKNVIRIWEDGKEKFYDMADPLFMEAFKGLEPVAIPSLKFMAKMSNMLRQSVVLYPLFSVAQVPQDAFAAMFSSGLKPSKAIKIPILALKEFVSTIANRSKVHDELKKFGAVGVRDFSSAIARNDAEIAAGLKGSRQVAGSRLLGKVTDMLEHISMASDNAVRQAVYAASLDAGISQAESIEKAFQLINFRNKGSSKLIAALGQVVPFFNAYIAAQHVAIKTLSGRGISPTERADALATLAATTAGVMMLSLFYAMAVGGDDDYEKTPKALRDRLFIIPGTDLRIPIRTDVFSLPKILTENLYMLMTDKGTMDGRKFRDSMKAAFANSVLGPTPVPQAFKPVAEVMLNRDFFQDRPIVGTYQQGLETERQFNDGTSEFSKLLGQTGLVSPLVADHVIRGMFGSVGGLLLAVTNPIIDAGTDVKAPAMDLQDMIASLPGTSAFVARPNQSALKADFYVLRDEVSKVVNTLNDLKARSPDEIDKYLEDEDKIAKLGLQKTVNRITADLSKIRREISRINQATDMSSDEKKAAIQEMKDLENDMLKDLDIKALRKMANL